MTFMNIWRMFTHHIDASKALEWTQQNGCIAVGWGRVGDVRNYETQNDVKNAIRLHYPIPPFRNNAHLGAPSLWSFCHAVQQGDLVILNGKAPRMLVVQIRGNYEFKSGVSPLEGEYFNQRSVEITNMNPDKVWALAGEAPGTQRYQTLVRCARSLNTEDLDSL